MIVNIGVRSILLQREEINRPLNLKLERDLHSLLILERDRFYRNVNKQIKPYYIRESSPSAGTRAHASIGS